MTRKPFTEAGFTLIELMIVVAIIGILAAVAIPGYIGFQEKSRRGALDRTAAAAEAELQGWLSAALSTGPGALLREVDTDYDGDVDSSDKTNAQLRSAGVASAYVSARAFETSPWSNSIQLWTAGSAGNGQIGLAQAGNIIYITAKDMDGRPVFTKRVLSD